MAKKLLLIFICLLIITGCNKYKQDESIKRLNLSSKYYDKGEFIEIKSIDLESIKDETYVIFTYNNYCSLPIPCEDVFKEFMKNYKIDFLSMPYEEFKKTNFVKTVKYAPSIIIVEKGKVISYLGVFALVTTVLLTAV